MPAPIEEGYNQVLLKYLLKRKQLYWWPYALSTRSTLPFITLKNNGGTNDKSIMPG
jgi:hypothetical protein